MVNLRITKTDQAEIDLLDIWLFIASDSVAAASRFGERLDESFRKLATHPGIGRDRSDLQPSLRSYPLGTYIILYRQVEDSLQIIRVLHGARDIPATFNQ